MQPRGGRRDRAIPPCEHRLIIRCVLRCRPVRTRNIRRQGQRARRHQPVLEIAAIVGKPQRHAATLAHRRDFRGKIIGSQEPQLVTRTQPPRIARQRMPGAIRERTVQRNADPGGAARSLELRRNDTRVVHHEQIAGAQQIRQIAHVPIAQRVPYHQQPRRVPRHRRMLRDMFRREMKIEIGGRERHER